MPANKKYLTKSTSQRFAKISAGLDGGYMVTESRHIALCLVDKSRKCAHDP